MSGISKRVSGSWVSRNYGIMKTSTYTITTLPAFFYANDTTTTVGLKGDMSQSSTPTSSSPIQPRECGERTGNLADVIRGKVPRIADGSLVTFEGLTTEYVPFHTGDILSITFEKPIQTKRFYVFYYIGDTLLANKDLAYGTTITSYGVPKTVDRIRIRIDYNGVEVSSIMLNSGSTALPYEPYGYKIPISSANTTTPVYLGEVETTRKIKKYVFTGEESGTIYSTATSRKGIEITGITGIIGGNADITILAICTHYQPNTRTALYRNTANGISNAYQNDSIIFYDTNCQTVEAFQQFCTQQYAAGTPVTVWYVLANETTGIVNEPLRKIGDYADTVSGITIPTIAGTNRFDVLTTLKPSEVIVNYKNWHPVVDVHERENGAWT